MDNILPAIRAKWPQGSCKTIYIQQDNAKPHILDQDIIFRQASTLEGFDIHLVQPPPNSPDMNVHDMAFFRSIQALQYQKTSYNYVQLTSVVAEAFQNMEIKACRNAWITLKACRIQVFKRMGGIDYSIPHMGKSKLARQGRLPDYLHVDTKLVVEVVHHLSSRVALAVLSLVIWCQIWG